MTKHTPGPWIMRGEADPEFGYDETQHAFGIEPAGEGRNGGWPYMIRQDREYDIGQTPLHLACGIQNLEDARLIAAAPDMLAALEGLERALRTDSRDKTILSDTVEYHLDGQAMYSAINEARTAIAKAIGE